MFPITIAIWILGVLLRFHWFQRKNPAAERISNFPVKFINWVCFQVENWIDANHVKKTKANGEKKVSSLLSVGSGSMRTFQYVWTEHQINIHHRFGQSLSAENSMRTHFKHLQMALIVLHSENKISFNSLLSIHWLHVIRLSCLDWRPFVLFCHVDETTDYIIWWPPVHCTA